MLTSSEITVGNLDYPVVKLTVGSYALVGMGTEACLPCDAVLELTKASSSFPL